MSPHVYPFLWSIYSSYQHHKAAAPATLPETLPATNSRRRNPTTPITTTRLPPTRTPKIAAYNMHPGSAPAVNIFPLVFHQANLPPRDPARDIRHAGRRLRYVGVTLCRSDGRSADELDQPRNYRGSPKSRSRSWRRAAARHGHPSQGFGHVEILRRSRHRKGFPAKRQQSARGEASRVGKNDLVDAFSHILGRAEQALNTLYDGQPSHQAEKA